MTRYEVTTTHKDQSADTTCFAKLRAAFGWAQDEKRASDFARVTISRDGDHPIYDSDWPRFASQPRTCAECEGLRFDVLYNDPRSPPLDYVDCLCVDCFETATVEAVEQKMIEVHDMTDALESVIGRKRALDALSDFIPAVV